ncbi:MAG: XTP/dITP diphosphatase [Promethearchaeota archaeon]
MLKRQEKLTFVTGNVHKFNEIKALLTSEEIDIDIMLNDRVKPMEIQSSSLEEVAEFKINSVKEKIDGSFFIEDSGFFVESLNGFPGVYSSYVMNVLGNEGILKLINGLKKRRAKFRSIIALYIGNKDKNFLFSGEVIGTIASKIRGTQGFGFDPIFISEKIPDKTFGELLTYEKNEISHRSLSFRKLIKFLKMKTKNN